MGTVAGWTFKNRTGRWTILLKNGRWWVYWNEEDLDHFHSPRAALEDLTGGHLPWPSSGIDPSECGLPDEFSDWSPLTRRK